MIFFFSLTVSHLPSRLQVTGKRDVVRACVTNYRYRGREKSPVISVIVLLKGEPDCSKENPSLYHVVHVYLRDWEDTSQTQLLHPLMIIMQSE